MNKQTLSAIAILLVTCILGFGLESAFDMTAYERLDKIMTSNVEVESYHVDATGKMSMGLESENGVPDYMSTVFKMYENMTLNISSDVVMKQDDFQMKMIEEIDMGGMTFEVEAYIKDEAFILKYPIFGQYISFTLEDMERIMEIDLPDTFMSDVIALIPDLQKESAEILMSYLNEENVKYADPYILNNNGYEQNLHVIEIEFDSETLVNIYCDLALALLENEKGIALAETVIEASGESIPEDFIENLDDLKTQVADFKKPDSELRLSMGEEMQTVLDNIHYNYKVGVSNINIPKMMWISVDMAMPMDGMDDVTMRAQYDLEYRLSKYNEIDEIELPPMDESDILRVDELIEKFGGL